MVTAWSTCLTLEAAVFRRVYYVSSKSLQTHIISNGHSVHCEVRTEVLYIIQTSISLERDAPLIMPLISFLLASVILLSSVSSNSDSATDWTTLGSSSGTSKKVSLLQIAPYGTGAHISSYSKFFPRK